MDLKANIHGTEYTLLAQGIVIAEEFNETLDSGSIIISETPEIIDLNPYDDVYIYDASLQFSGDTTGAGTTKFHRHFLVDQYTREQLILGQDVWKYKIQLMSETKGLDAVILPSKSITQPIASSYTSVWTHIQRALELYNPKVKIEITGAMRYAQQGKYTLDNNLQSLFGGTPAPEMTMNTPTLREWLSRLFITKDCIPVVRDHVIYAMDIGTRTGEFDKTKGEINYVVGSKSSSNYCENLSRRYGNGLSQNNTCKFVDYVGFRNKNKALMTLSDLRIETRFPIYKINKVYMCYYKKVQIKNINDQLENKDMAFLCKQDITSLVLLNSKRNALNNDYVDYERTVAPTTTEEAAQYKFCTVGYDIGSNTITGWGEKYSFYLDGAGWWSKDRTYIENLVRIMGTNTPYGIYTADYLTSKYPLEAGEYLALPTGTNGEIDSILAIDTESIGKMVGNLFTLNSTLPTAPAQKLKQIFFQIEYEGFYNGLVTYAKDGAKRELVSNIDNTSGSLSLLESDGLFEKEKANRLGNEALQINARYTDYADMQPLGSTYEDSNSDDNIVYRREFSIYDNAIICTYVATKDYVLKNYFTSVYSKHRPFELASYDESVRRSENVKNYLMLSTKNCYDDMVYINPDQQVTYTPASKNRALWEETKDGTSNITYFLPDDRIEKMLCSCFQEGVRAETKGYYPQGEEINGGFFLNWNAYKTADDYINDEHEDSTTRANKNYQGSDINKFVAGHSLCFNLAMPDNITNGTYIKQIAPKINEDATDDYTGTLQGWQKMTDLIAGFTDGGSIADYKGTWQVSTTYYDSNIVYYSGYYYMCLSQEGTTNVPTNTADWKRVYTITTEKGEIERAGIYVATIDNKETFNDYLHRYKRTWGSNTQYSKGDIVDYTDTNGDKILKYYVYIYDTNTSGHLPTNETYWRNIYKDIYELPSMNNTSVDVKNCIGTTKRVYKDNKEVLDYTFQIEPITDDNNVKFSQWFMRLNDLVTTEHKTRETYEVEDNISYNTATIMRHTTTVANLGDLYNEIYLGIKHVLYFPSGTLPAADTLLNGEAKWEYSINMIRFERFITGTTLKFEKVDESILGTSIKLKCEQTTWWTQYWQNWNIKDTVYYRYNFLDPNDQDNAPYIQAGYDAYLLDTSMMHYTDNGTHYYVDEQKYIFAKNDAGHRIAVESNHSITEYATSSIETTLVEGTGGSTQTYTYEKNMFVCYSTEKMKSEVVYEKLTSVSGIDSTKDVGLIFTFQEDEKKVPYIYVDLTGVTNSTKSIRYYYKKDGYYNFVFGVNITPADINRGYVKIYTSLISNRDTNIYDATTRQVTGTEYNFATNPDGKTFGTGRYFKR